MSSEISIEAPRAAQASAPVVKPEVKNVEGFQPWHFFVLVSILLATIAVLMARQAAPEHLVLLSLTIAAAGAAAGAFYRTLAPLVSPIVLRGGEPVSERTREALEREKMLVLRSIKELEFDRAMGKLSQKDFDEMSGRLRARALSLMKQLEVGSVGYTPAIERELTARLAAAPPAAVARSSSVAAGACVCGTVNDADALFCKKCGTRLQP
jgi:hypothetical protein